MTTKTAERVVSWGVFFLLLLTYWLTAAPTVSFWDCPEYVSAAWRLEVGHPPGNPTWMLVERVFTMLAPSGKYAAWIVNLSSGLFTAFAAYFLARTLFAAIGWVQKSLKAKRWPLLTRCVGAMVGALSFGWCDSTWYSAIEAEVYAFSIFMTALCVWIAVKWAYSSDYTRSTRYLFLLAYLFGLSLGIHQLNLLCIPALAIIWSIKRGVRAWYKIALVLFLSLTIVACILKGIMPSTISIASELELFCVNTLHLPFLSGVVLYILLLGCALIGSIVVTWYSRNPGVLSVAIFPAIFLSGMFIFSDHIAVGCVVSALISIVVVRGYHFSARRLNICMWLLALLLTGYSSYALIPIRGGIPSPANSSLPGDPFSFASYQAREQYGASPLLYGHTPYSHPILREEFNAESGKPEYRRILLERGHPVVSRKEAGARVSDPYLMLTSEDSVANARILNGKGDGYVVRSYHVRPILTPELDMWFPRITSRDEGDLPSFEAWAGMDKESMVKVDISEAVDSAGNFVNKLDYKGRRKKVTSYRPTYAQSMRMLFGYQIGYMYFRYLLWNFMGRQNDVHSTGEIEHGNFITGITPVDNLMLGAEEALPDAIGKDNEGRNVYFLLPFLLGIAGIIFLCAAGKRGHKVCLTNLMLFIMTGLAIVVYLNQGPGEPRERDYSFLGSYWAFALWIGFGAVWLMRLAGRYAPLIAAVPLFSAAWMCIENYKDHDRGHRYAASNIAANILNSLEPDAIIFVDGDNCTFPLWYAQEVEGIRRDVRVINMAYLGVPQYVGALMQDWDGSQRLELTLGRGDIIYGALQFPTISRQAQHEPAGHSAILRDVAAGDSPVFNYRTAWLPLPSGDSIIYPLSNLARIKGGSAVDFRKMVIFDIIATNAASARPRTVYWHQALSPRHYIGLDTLLQRDLYTWRFGQISDSDLEKRYNRDMDEFLAPNPPDKDIYMDGAPLTHVSIHRASLTAAAEQMLDAGRVRTALRLGLAADSLMGRHPRSWQSVRFRDYLYNTPVHLASLLEQLADTLSNTGEKDDQLIGRRLRSRSAEIRSRDSLRAEQWKRYVRTLPPQKRLKVSRN